MTTESWDDPLLKGWGLRLLFALVMVFLVFPGLDQGISALFFDPASGRFVNEGPLLHLLRKGVPPFLYATLLFLVLLWAGDRLVPGRRADWPSGRQIGFLVASLALGPGLLVNGVLKEWWGRARPDDTTLFGGEATFTPAWMIADQCATNCSFVSGHASLGFWTVALALIAPAARRQLAVTAALVFGTVMSAARVIVGAHFASDVIFAGIITVTLTMWLHRTMIPER